MRAYVHVQGERDGRRELRRDGWGIIDRTAYRQQARNDRLQPQLWRHDDGGRMQHFTLQATLAERGRICSRGGDSMGGVMWSLRRLRRRCV
jgi:predicted alpha/beta-hydrolase family hydrolase